MSGAASRVTPVVVWLGQLFILINAPTNIVCVNPVQQEAGRERVWGLPALHGVSDASWGLCGNGVCTPEVPFSSSVRLLCLPRLFLHVGEKVVLALSKPVVKYTGI